MSTASAMIDRYIAIHGDTRASGLLRLNERYSRMVVEAQWFQKEATVATTVADQASYAMPSTIEDLRAVYVNGVKYEPVSMEDLRSLADPDSDNFTSVPVFAEDYDTTGALLIELYPVPDTAGDAIVGISSGSPVALTDSTNAAGTPSIPADLHTYLFDGLNSDGYLFVSERTDMAAVFDGRFQEGVRKLVNRRNSRFGSGPRRFGVSVGGA